MTEILQTLTLIFVGILDIAMLAFVTAIYNAEEEMRKHDK